MICEPWTGKSGKILLAEQVMAPNVFAAQKGPTKLNIISV